MQSMDMEKGFVEENGTLNTERPSIGIAPWLTYCLDEDMAPGGTNMSCDHFPVMSRSIDVKTSSKQATSTCNSGKCVTKRQQQYVILNIQILCATKETPRVLLDAMIHAEREMCSNMVQSVNSCGAA